jgi:maltoporin
MQSAYEERIQSLENRIQELEKEKPAAQSVMPATTNVSAAAVSGPTTGAALPPVPDSYSIEWMKQYVAQLEAVQARQAELIKKEDDLPKLDFHGYLRSGYGITSYGNTMTPFQAPNSGAKYRLGNEAETYLETTFLMHMPKSKLPEGVIFDTQIRLAYVIPHNQNNNASTETSLREAFGIARGVLSDMPEAAFWAGQRFYSRRDIHMNDFYYRDMSGYGGGIEDVPVGDGDTKFSFALLGGSSDNLDSSGTQFDDNNYQLNMNTVDLGLYDTVLGPGKISFYGTFSDFNGDTFTETDGDVIILKSSEGFAGNLFYDFPWSKTVSDTFALQYGQGPAYAFRALMTRPAGFISMGDTVFDTEELEKFRVLNNVLLDEGGPWTYEAIALYEEGNFGLAGDSKNRWLSGGIRPVYHFNRYFSLALEGGADYTDNDRYGNGTLGKFTIAPQITPEAKHLSRPALRAFLTYAWWADDFEGTTGGSDYADDLEGVTVGVQMETWW